MAVIQPSVPSTTAFSPPPNMQEIVWVLDATTGYYDIQNQYTASGNTGNLQVIQSKILITLNTFQGEWAADPSFGIPIATINQNSDHPDVIGQIFANEILTVQNVNNVTINSFDYTPTTRFFSASFNVNTVYGITQVILGS